MSRDLHGVSAPPGTGRSVLVFGIHMTRGRKIAFMIASALIFVIAGVAIALIVGPPGPMFVCHRGLVGTLDQWMLETTNKVTYPNVDGSSSRSLAVLVSYVDLQDTNVLRDYRYVPGLRSDDPESLILFYVRQASRRTWHGDTHWLRRDKRWVVLNPQCSTPDDVDAKGWSECAEAISTGQLRTRLKATLDYLKSKDRPGWQAATAEHTEFLKRIKE